MAVKQFESVDEAVEIFIASMCQTFHNEIPIAKALAIGLIRDPKRRINFFINYQKTITDLGGEIPEEVVYILKQQEGGQYDQR